MNKAIEEAKIGTRYSTNDLNEIYYFSPEIKNIDLSHYEHLGKYAIYRVWCAQGSASYVGQTKNLKERITLHLANLRRGIHTHKTLQDLYNLHGADSISYEILELIQGNFSSMGTRKLVNDRERFWQQQFKTKNAPSKKESELRITATELKNDYFLGLLEAHSYLYYLIRALRKDGWRLHIPNVDIFCEQWGFEVRTFYRAKAKLAAKDLIEEKNYGSIDLVISKRYQHEHDTHVMATDTHVMATDTHVMATDTHVMATLSKPLSSNESQDSPALIHLLNNSKDQIDQETISKNLPEQENAKTIAVTPIIEDEQKYSPVKNEGSNFKTLEAIASIAKNAYQEIALHEKAIADEAIAATEGKDPPFEPPPPGRDRSVPPPRENASQNANMAPSSHEKDLADLIIRSAKARGVEPQNQAAYVKKCLENNRADWEGKLAESKAKTEPYRPPREFVDEWRVETAIALAIQYKDFTFARGKIEALRQGGHVAIAERMLKKFKEAIA